MSDDGHANSHSDTSPAEAASVVRSGRQPRSVRPITGQQKTGGQRPAPSAAAATAMPPDADSIIGRLIGDAREDAGVPQTAAAAALGVPQSRIAKLELGRRRLLFVEAALLAELYGVRPDAFDPRSHSPRLPSSARRHRVDLPRSSRSR